MNPGGRWFPPIALLVLGTAALLASAPLRQPTVPIGDFEAATTARALRHVEAMARSAHPPGTPEHAEVRRYLLATLAELGVEAEVATATVVDSSAPDRAEGATLHNVVARLRGTTDDPPVLLVAHYDSVPEGPGAADDAAAVAALLETLRHLAQGPPLRRDVVALFSDGEELGLLGAKTFAAGTARTRSAGPADLDLDDVGLVLNFEARGNRGPSLMFETLENSGPWIRRLRDTPRPVAFSFSRDAYPLLGNDTDLSAFRGHGLAGLNFAFIDGARAYHGPLDTPEALAAGSLAHHGAQALALARRAALEERGPETDDSSDLAFFTLPGVGLVIHPLGGMIPLAALLLVVTILLLVVAVRRGALTAGGLALALLGVPFLVALSAGVAVTLHRLLFIVLGRTPSMVEAPGWYVLGGLLVAAGVLLVLLRRRPRPVEIAGATLAWWSSMAVAAAILVPSSSYLLLWPGLFAVLGYTVLVASVPRPADEGPPASPAPLAGAGLLLLSLPAVLLWAPTLELLAVGFGIGGLLPVAALGALLLCLLAPVVLPAATTHRPWLAVALLGTGAALLVAGAAGARHDERRPQRASLFYALDTETGSAHWGTFDRRPTPWAAGVLGAQARPTPLGHFFGGEDRELTAATAPVLPLPAPRVEVVEAAGDRLVLEVRSPRGAPVLNLELASAEPFRVVSVAGRELETHRTGSAIQEWNLRYHAPPADGLEVVLEDVASPVSATVIDWEHHLPVELAPEPPPPAVAPRTFAMVRSTSTLDPDAVVAAGPGTEPQPETEPGPQVTPPAVPPPSE